MTAKRLQQIRGSQQAGRSADDWRRLSGNGSAALDAEHLVALSVYNSLGAGQTHCPACTVTGRNSAMTPSLYSELMRM